MTLYDDVIGGVPDEFQRNPWASAEEVPAIDLTSGFSTELPPEPETDNTLRLLQPSSGEVELGEAVAGSFTFAQEAYRSLLVVPIGYKVVRSLYNPNDRQVVCVSNDGVLGEGVPGGECGSCRYRTGQCRRDEIWRLWLPNAEEVALFTFRGNATTFRTSLRQLHKAVQATGFNTTSLVMTSRLRGQSTRQSYIPVFTPTEFLEEYTYQE